MRNVSLKASYIYSSYYFQMEYGFDRMLGGAFSSYFGIGLVSFSFGALKKAMLFGPRFCSKSRFECRS